jgi:hypothetical protein
MRRGARRRQTKNLTRRAVKTKKHVGAPVERTKMEKKFPRVRFTTGGFKQFSAATAAFSISATCSLTDGERADKALARILGKLLTCLRIDAPRL